MGIFGSSKTRVTPEQMGMVLVKATNDLAFEGNNSLHALLQQSDGPPDSRRVQYGVELMVFVLFGLDFLVCQEITAAKDRVRSSARENLREAVNGFLQENNVAAGFSAQEWEDFVSSRFAAYAGTLVSGVSQVPLLALSRLAYANMKGHDERDPEALMKIAAFFGCEMKAYREAIRAYRVVA